MTKNDQFFFSGKNRADSLTPSVAAPGDTHPSDATVVTVIDTIRQFLRFR